MTVDQYKTLGKMSTSEFKDKGSRFIACVFPCKTIEEFEEKMEVVKKEHFKARHHCYAYRIGILGEVFRSNDDGEPGGSAGLPILNQLKSKELTNIGAIVVRYFGGTKLGVSGLINAYKTSTQSSIEHGEIIQITIGDLLKINFEYSEMGNLMNILKKKDLKIQEKSFETKPFVTLEIRRAEFEDKLIDLKAAICGISINEYTQTEPEMKEYSFEEIRS